MKRYSCFFIPAIILLFSSVTQAQYRAGDIHVGLGVTYGLDIMDDGEPGINFNSYYSITDEIRLGADFTYYLVDQDWIESPSIYELNLNAQYFILNDDFFRLYASLGLHYASVSYDIKGLGLSHSDSETGGRLGGGVELDFDSIIFFVEPAYTIGGFEQLAITAGGRIFF